MGDRLQRVGSTRSPNQEADLRRDLLASDRSGAVSRRTCLPGHMTVQAEEQKSTANLRTAAPPQITDLDGTEGRMARVDLRP
jgi:hypothetical protein